MPALQNQPIDGQYDPKDKGAWAQNPLPKQLQWHARDKGTWPQKEGLAIAYPKWGVRPPAMKPPSKKTVGCTQISEFEFAKFTIIIAFVCFKYILMQAAADDGVMFVEDDDAGDVGLEEKAEDPEKVKDEGEARGTLN